MSQMTDAWDSLYAVQTSAIGAAQVVTIGSDSDVAAIITEAPIDGVYVDGGTGEARTVEIQVKASSLSTEPSKYDAVGFVVPGSAIGFSGNVLSIRRNNGILYLLAGDPNATQ